MVLSFFSTDILDFLRKAINMRTEEWSLHKWQVSTIIKMVNQHLTPVFITCSTPSLMNEYQSRTAFVLRFGIIIL